MASGTAPTCPFDVLPTREHQFHHGQGAAQSSQNDPPPAIQNPSNFVSAFQIAPKAAPGQLWGAPSPPKGAKKEPKSSLLGA